MLVEKAGMIHEHKRKRNEKTKNQDESNRDSCVRAQQTRHSCVWFWVDELNYEVKLCLGLG